VPLSSTTDHTKKMEQPGSMMPMIIDFVTTMLVVIGILFFVFVF
jgi:hypothetical protein